LVRSLRAARQHERDGGLALQLAEVDHHLHRHLLEREANDAPIPRLPQRQVTLAKDLPSWMAANTVRRVEINHWSGSSNEDPDVPILFSSSQGKKIAILKPAADLSE